MSGIKEQLVDSSRIVGEIVASRVAYNPVLFDEVFQLAMYEKKPMSSRAGRVLDLCVLKNPGLVLPYINEIFDQIKKGKVLHRCFLFIFAEKDICLTEEQEGILFDACLTWLLQNGQEVAIQIYCMDIMLKIARKEPELAQEIAEAIKTILPFGTPGVLNRGHKTLKALKNLKK